MGKLRLWVALAMGGAFLVATVPPLTAADSTCPAGFAVVQGGVPEADLNGDGLTCEVERTDGSGAVTLVSLDNSAASGAPAPCPDGFAAFGPWPPGMDPDRNGNGIICVKELPGERIRAIAIDDVRKATTL
jgi:hypothetical protein